MKALRLVIGAAFFAAGLVAQAERIAPALLEMENGVSIGGNPASPNPWPIFNWERRRRPEIMEMFTRWEFGRRSVERPSDLAFKVVSCEDALGGTAVKKVVRISYSGPYAKSSFDATMYLPKTRFAAPAYLLISNRGRPDELKPEYWPYATIVKRGYAAVTFCYGDVAADDPATCFETGVFKCYFQPGAKRADDSWGALSAWAWGASRVMDYLVTEPLVDSQHVAVIGHSRGGKAALWAGATDKRFACAVSNDSGCGGAKLNSMDLPESEHIAQITARFPHWFAPNYAKWAGRESVMPFDQHMLIAAMAPRLVGVGSAWDDKWAGPEGERASALSAAAAWWAKGRRQAFDYTMREGGHGLWTKCWDHYMDIADANWRGKTVVVNSSIQRALDEKSRPLTVIVPKGVYEITETLKIHSGTHLILHPEARLVVSGLKPHHVGEFLLTNADEENGDTDIRIEGGVWDGNKEVGFNLKEPQERKFDPDAWSGCTLNFRNVKNLKLSDMTLANSVTFNVRLCEVDGFEIRNIRIVSPIIKNNQDGIHLGGRCFNGVIDGVTVDTRGQTNDDLIAINADDSVTRHENRGTVNGPITNIVVRHVFAEDCHCFIRLLRAYSEIKDITVEDCAVGVRYHAINGDDARKWIAHGSGRAGCPNPPGVVSEKDLPESTGVLDNVVFRRCSFWCSWAMGYPTEQSSFPLIQLDGVLGPRGVKFEDVYRDMRLDQDRKRPTCKDERAAKLFSAR